MKENLISDKSLIYQWNFNDNSSVVNNPRIKATVVGNPTFKNGVCQFGNGTTNTTDSYTLKRIVNLGVTFSVSVKFKFNTLTGDAGILAYDGSTYALYLISGRLYFRAGVSSPYISFNRDLNWHEFTLTRNGSSASAYLDGISQTINGSVNSPQNTLIKYIGSGSSGSYNLFNGQLEYIKIWNRQLTASEVKNNYNSKTYRSLPYVSSEILSNEIVSNNGYDTDTYWIKQSGWTINNGTAICTNIPGTGAVYYPVPTVITGKLYKITYTIVQCTAGSGFAAGVGNNIGQYRTISGTYTDYLNCGGTQNVGIYGLTGTSGVVDNISLKEVLQSSKNTLFHINSDNGVIRDLTGKTVPVATNVALPKIGSNINVMKFNGSSGNINLGNQALVGDITFMGWINNTNRGEGSIGTIINNSQLSLRNSSAISNVFSFSRNNDGTVFQSNIGSIKLANTQFICITSTSTGITNFYIGDKNNPPILSGTAYQSAGTPVAGTTCYLGNRAADDRTLNGWLNDVRLEQSILTLEEVTQYWSLLKQKYQ